MGLNQDRRVLKILQRDMDGRLRLIKTTDNDNVVVANDNDGELRLAA